MYRDVTQWTRIRRCVLTGGVSQRNITREAGISRETVRKMIEFPIPPGYLRVETRQRSVDAILHARAQPHQEHPQAQQFTSIAQLARRNPDFRQSSVAQQDRQPSGVQLVGLLVSPMRRFASSGLHSLGR
jgi:DNA-binding transcriptional regulator LsrR (DeoR family)